MAEVEFRFPSNKPYAYVGVKGTPEELGLDGIEPGYLARVYAEKLSVFLAEEKAALTKTNPKPVEIERTIEEALADELGAQVISETEKSDPKPWEQNNAPAEAKPWEAPAAADVDWDI